MKVAICFSGALRSFDTCIYSTIKYLINQFNNPDIFLHLWDFKKDNTNIEYNFKWRDNTTDIPHILNILNPKDYIIEKYDNNQEQKIIELSEIDITKFDDEKKKNYGFNCCSMYYKILKAFELAENYSKKNNITYDLYVRARLDFIWEDKIMFDKIKENTIYLIKDRYATHSKLITNDKFFAGNYETMKRMCNIFNNIKDYQKEDILIEGQTINEYHIKKNNFDVIWLGDKNTYYKCMGRHEITNKNIKYNIIVNDFIINKELEIFINELIYKLTNKGFILNNKDKLITILHNYNKIITDNNSNNIKDIKIILINDYYKIIIDENIIEIKENLIINNNFSDFITNIMEYNKKNINCKINEIKKNLNYEINDVILYKFMDKGYYQCKIIDIDKNTNKIIINHENTNKKINNNNDITIINYMKYFNNNILYF